MAKKTLEQWIRETLTDKEKEGPCVQLTLVHMVGMAQKELHTIRLGATHQWTEDSLATMFRDKAQTYCQDLPGVQTFQLLGFYGSKGVAEAFMPFVINVNSHDAFGGLGTETPTDQGERSAWMRRGEMLFQQTYRRQQQMDDYMIRALDKLGNMMNDKDRQIIELSRENRDAFTIVKEMLMERSMNEHKHKMEQLTYERASGERKKWLTFVPAIVNTVLGREVFPQSTADTALIEAIADSMTEEDVMKVASVIRPELMGPLATRMQQYTKKKNDEQEALKQLSAIQSPDPEADAAGDVVSNNVLGNGKTH